MDSVLLEKLMIKACMQDTGLLAILTSTFSPEYFDNSTASKIYRYIIENFKQYQTIPPKVSIIAEFDKDNDDTSAYITEVESIDFSLAQNYSMLFDSINDYLKDKALKKAILSSVDLINENSDERAKIRTFIDDALSKDLKIDLGLNYFNDLKERLIRILTTDVKRVPTYFPTFDDYISGGFPAYTLSIMIARIHGWKSAFLANIASRQVLNGQNVVLSSLEMSEDAFSQRFDALFSLYDINKIYRDSKIRKELPGRLTNVKETPGRGDLWIKQYPTGKATVEDFRRYMRELQLRGNKIDIFICDYMNLMKPAYKSRGEMYMDVKTISEELRALSFEFKIPVISVSQLNREGMNIPFEQVDFTYISESIGAMASADFALIFGSNETQAVYESELFYKIVKNRLGGRVGVIDKFYIDFRNLKMYDSMELEQWQNDARISGDTRKLAEIADRAESSRGQRSRGRREDRR